MLRDFVKDLTWSVSSTGIKCAYHTLIKPIQLKSQSANGQMWWLHCIPANFYMPTSAMHQSFYPSTVSLQLFIYSPIHHSIHQSQNRWPFRSPCQDWCNPQSSPRPYHYPQTPLLPPTPTPDGAISLSRTPKPTICPPEKDRSSAYQLHEMVARVSARVTSLCVCEGQSTKRSPQRELSAFGPWGLSRGIIDDVFITRCGLMWGLGHSMSVCACV